MENLLVKVGKFVFPTDFVILDMEEDDHILLILGRPFLAAARALVDMSDSTLKLRVGEDKFIFRVGKSYGLLEDPVQFVDSVDVLLEKEMKKLEKKKIGSMGCFKSPILNKQILGLSRAYDSLIYQGTSGS